LDTWARGAHNSGVPVLGSCIDPTAANQAPQQAVPLSAPTPLLPHWLSAPISNSQAHLETSPTKEILDDLSKKAAGKSTENDSEKEP
jgi:hypothetical protein